ncbi:MAG TPA: DsbA family protein [Candidatus Dormibacteraeota bacterium]|nr:DsbA family protein [Candidatus Dormibacteraeota bacterium]
MSPAPVTVYIDFLCPWAYRGSMWLAEVEKAGRIQVSWRFFSLSQNHQAREGVPGPPVWEANRQAAGLPAFLAASAARAQGKEGYNRFRELLQRARHEDRLPVDAHATHLAVAKKAGLDVGRWEEDLAGASFEQLAAEHAEAVALGVFGVPTLVWPEGRSYYLKLTDLVPAERAVPLYDAIETVQRFAEVVEIKTPESEGTLAA